MGKTKGPYKAEFPVGAKVRIAERPVLEEFRRTWKYHHFLQSEQLDYAGAAALVESIAFYHGGDEVYWLKGVPGVWHERCLNAAMAEPCK